MSDEIAQDPWAQRVYMTWLARDARYALEALERLMTQAHLDPMPPAAWFYLESFLAFTGKVSRMLRPVEQKSHGQTNEGVQWRLKRGAYLRSVLGIEDASPLCERGVRNASEHFDERLDEWVVHHPRPTLTDLESGTATFPAPPMRLINAQSWTVEVVDVVLELKPVDQELRRILARIEELQPLAGLQNPEAAAMLGSLFSVPLVSFSAPTQRPDEDVTAGVMPAE
ncbi:hypothetical protein OHA98_42430 [Streptomyces sp. NBC_00654]|uniref:hypothetical protein n=1 Tax=Streptomyces sp. NBC_00654 TaxID=2975799 RepID=UPI002258A49C|nr:hypothetical protein [Streptomyces sp. NBC_00654]MCX4971258.1 hypothetical protein [Streptomyces sp. NBC_00654]MCX4971259.1 hypothetical protein [Streptomyces sp. NBC_00654]